MNKRAGTGHCSREQPTEGKDGKILVGGLSSPVCGWGLLGWPRPSPCCLGGGSLADIDECVTGIHNCSINETCFNIQGGFRCLAFDCPENYRRSADT